MNDNKDDINILIEKIKNDFSKPVSLNVFGTCATVDAIQRLRAENCLTLNTVASRQSIISSVSQPVNWIFEDVEYVTYGKRTIQFDFEKNIFDHFKKDNSDYFIIDLVDERFKNIYYENSLITLSSSLNDNLSTYCDQIKNPTYSYINKILTDKGWYFYLNYNDNQIPLTNYFDTFVEKILNIYDTSNIILHKVYYSYYYVDKDNNIKPFANDRQNWCKNMNIMLEYMYNYLEFKLNGCFIIDISHNFLASEKHQWGLSPFHYEDNYIFEFEKILSEFFIKNYN